MIITIYNHLRFYLFLILGSSMAIISLNAQTKLPAFFGDGMVLQQKVDAAIWGNDTPFTKIYVHTGWNETEQTQTDHNGKWKVSIATPEAGGPYQIVIEGSQRIELKDVLIGEVWFCSGQSNMEMPLKGFPNQPIIGSNEAILNSENANIRLFTVQRNASIWPLDDVAGEWKTSRPETAREFSAVAYFFGKKLHETTGVPIGLIASAWGGSSCETWTDIPTLAEHIQAEEPKEVPVDDRQKRNTPSLLYNAMVHPFFGFQIAGVIWYQGESNKYGNRAASYKDIFPAMIRLWRTKWNQGDFPFYFVQIAPFTPKAGNTALLREAQLYTLNTVKNTGMIVTLDLGDCSNIHPAQKKEVGDRLAYWALANTYSIEGISYSGPIYRDMEVQGNRAIIYFDHADMGLSNFGRSLNGFQIAGEDSVFHDAIAKIENTKVNSLSISSDQVNKPVAVRYAYDHCPEATLFNTAGLPASPFRTDGD